MIFWICTLFFANNIININAAVSLSDSFNYTDPNKDWPIDYPTCGGSKQSPIDITNIGLKLFKKRFKLTGYDNPAKSMDIMNYRSTIMVKGDWDEDKVPTAEGGPLTEKYQLEQFHFHWGATNEKGSEHMLYGQGYTMELHLVHFKKSYGSFQEALQHDDGLAIIAHVFTISNKTNDAIEQLKGAFPYIKNSGTHATLFPTFPLNDFGTLDEGSHIVYKGSITIPPCSENVQWILSTREKQVTAEEMDSFRSVKLAYADDHNNRPVQNSNGRKVFYM